MAYGYDALDRLNAVTDANGSTSYTYDPVGNLATVTYPNGVAHSHTYDTRNRLTNLGVAKGATAIAGYGYTLDAAGHRTAVSELSGRKVNYAYDSIYRLTTETIASDPNAVNGAIGYTYDAVGNRKQISLHEYLYVNLDPVDNADPSGNEIDELLSSLGVFDTLQSLEVLQARPFINRAKVEVHFDRLGYIFGKAYHHAYLLVRNLQGPALVFRGGPRIGDNPNAAADVLKDALYLSLSKPGFGTLTSAGSGTPFLPGTAARPAAPDFPSKPGDDVASVQVPNVLSSFSEIVSDFKNVARHIDDLRLEYRPVHQNSNSFAHTLLVKS
jgi:YD repeat-containing protein